MAKSTGGKSSSKNLSHLKDEMIAFLAEHAGLCRRFKFFRFAVGERVYAEWLRRVSVA